MYIEKQFNYSSYQIIDSSDTTLSNWFKSVLYFIKYNYDVDYSKDIEINFYNHNNESWLSNECFVLNTNEAFTNIRGDLILRAINMEQNIYINKVVPSLVNYNNGSNINIYKDRYKEVCNTRKIIMKDLCYFKIKFPIKD